MARCYYQTTKYLPPCVSPLYRFSSTAYNSGVVNNTSEYRHDKNFRKTETKQAKGQGSSMTPFITRIENCKATAKRSILVNASRNHLMALEKYCTDLGSIHSIWPYEVNGGDFALIEFAELANADQIAKRISVLPFGLREPECKFLMTPKLKFGSTTSKYVKKFESLDADTKQLLINVASEDIQLNLKIMKLYTALKQSETEERIKFFLVSQVEHIFDTMYKGVTIYPFGSTVNGFGKKGADLDVVAVYPQHFASKNMPNERFISWSKNMHNNEINKKYLDNFSKILPIAMPMVTDIQNILNAKVPIIKFHHKTTNIHCDVSVNQGSGVQMSELLYIMGEYNRYLRPLIMFFREWAKAQNITNSHPGYWITNFTIAMLVTFFLQTKKLLPTINMLERHASANDVYVDADRTIYKFNRSVRQRPRDIILKNEDDVGKLLFELFDYYAAFNFRKDAICLRNGKIESKMTNSPMLIINPFLKSLNITKNVSLDKVQEFQQKLGYGARLINQQYMDSTLLLHLLTRNCDNYNERTLYYNTLENKANL